MATAHRALRAAGLAAAAGTLVFAAACSDRDDTVVGATAPGAMPPPAVAASVLPPVATAPDPSVPDAKRALPAGDAPVPSTEDAASGVRSDVPSTLTPRESSTAMPKPGQNNDHSAPVNDARRSDR